MWFVGAVLAFVAAVQEGPGRQRLLKPPSPVAEAFKAADESAHTFAIAQHESLDAKTGATIMKKHNSNDVHDGGRAPSPDVSQNRNRLWLVWAGAAASVGVLSWLLGAPDIFHVIDAWPIALGVCVSILLFPVALRGAVWIKSDAAAAGKGCLTGGDIFLRR